MDNRTYSEKLLDPKWQRKKTEIQMRDNFTCQKCQNTEKTLYVHHRYYIYGREPWDYPDDLLILLCKDCHDDEEWAKDVLHDMPKVLAANGFFNTEMLEIIDDLISAKEIING